MPKSGSCSGGQSANCRGAIPTRRAYARCAPRVWSARAASLYDTAATAARKANMAKSSPRRRDASWAAADSAADTGVSCFAEDVDVERKFAKRGSTRRPPIPTICSCLYSETFSGSRALLSGVTGKNRIPACRAATRWLGDGYSQGSS